MARLDGRIEGSTDVRVEWKKNEEKTGATINITSIEREKG